jgi:putative oxygen-independent coproporphyrinogen III oxidase
VDADLAHRPVVTSVFIGGGTPSLVDASKIARVVAAVRTSWPVSPDVEVTIECNPESTTAKKLDRYLAAGINRISFGVQSLDAGLLATLGRQHDAGTAVAAIRLSRARGFDNVSADLIFGVPGETDESWGATLHGILEAGPSHVSCYALIYEEGTPLESWRKLGKVIPVDDDAVAARWELADHVLTRAGLERYEISNWGGVCRHNGLYWATGEYLGLGAGAHSHLATAEGAVRSWTVKSPERYIDAIDHAQRPVAGSEEIDPRTRAAEIMLLGLRRTAGVRESDFAALVGQPLGDVYAPELADGVASGRLTRSDGRVRVAKPFLANAAILPFV